MISYLLDNTRQIALKIRNSYFFWKYFFSPSWISKPNSFDDKSRVLIIGSDSDIAKSFIAILQSSNICSVFTTRHLDRLNLESYNKHCTTIYLDLSAPSITEDLHHPAFDLPFSHIVSFAGKLDRGATTINQITNNSIEDLPDVISSNATGLYQTLQALIQKHSSYYKCNHLSIAVLTTSYSLEGFPTGLSNLGYRASKTLLNLLLSNLYLECRRYNMPMTILMCGPGFVKTKMTSYSGDISADQSALILYRNIIKYGEINKMIYVSSTSKTIPLV
jgi:short-subunit dehydrogenase